MPRFRHQPLERPAEHIRLLNIERCDGVTELKLSVAAYDLKGAPAYDALSYEWGDEEPTVEIFVNGGYFHIRHNLFLLLVELWRQQAHGRQVHILLWADAICIDQSHLEERNAQVAMMGDIYRNATTVFAWLGWPHTDVDTALVTAFVANFSKLSAEQIRTLRSAKGVPSFRGSSYQTLLQSVVSLCTCNYWYRRWIIQELVLAREVVILWGKSQVPFREVENFINRLRPCEDDLKESDLEKSEVEDLGLGNELLGGIPAHVASLRSASNISGSRYPLLELMVSFKRAKCSVAVDQIFALLELAQEKGSIPVDYGIPLGLLLDRILTVIGWKNENRLFRTVNGSPTLHRRHQSRPLIYRGLGATVEAVRSIEDHRRRPLYCGRITELFEMSHTVDDDSLGWRFLPLVTKIIPTVGKGIDGSQGSQALRPRVFKSDRGLLGVTSALARVGDLLMLGRDSISEMLANKAHSGQHGLASTVELVCDAAIHEEDTVWLWDRWGGQETSDEDFLAQKVRRMCPSANKWPLTTLSDYWSRSPWDRPYSSSTAPDPIDAGYAQLHAFLHGIEAKLDSTHPECSCVQRFEQTKPLLTDGHGIARNLPCWEP